MESEAHILMNSECHDDGLSTDATHIIERAATPATSGPELRNFLPPVEDQSHRGQSSSESNYPTEAAKAEPAGAQTHPPVVALWNEAQEMWIFQSLDCSGSQLSNTMNNRDSGATRIINDDQHEADHQAIAGSGSSNGAGNPIGGGLALVKVPTQTKNAKNSNSDDGAVRKLG